MTAFYKAEKEIQDLMRELIANYHPILAQIDEEMVVVFREKAGKAGGLPVLGKAKKASPLLGVLGDVDYKFILEIAADEWITLTERQKKALLDHLLCSCLLEEDAEAGTIKCSVVPADVAFYWDELDRWGDWRPRPSDGSGPKGPSTVMEVFGKKDADEESDED